MTLEKAIESFGKNFVSIPVENIRYWDDLEMYLGDVIIGTKHHPEGSSIAFEFYDDIGGYRFIAYKPMNCYHK